MKARMILSDGSLYLHLCSGKSELISDAVAREFLLSFDDPEFYSGPEEMKFRDLNTEPYDGVIIAFVDDDDVLHVINSAKFREIFTEKETKLLTAPEYAALHGKKPAIINRFCLQGRLKGAIQKGGYWLIPEDAPYPTSENKSF